MKLPVVFFSVLLTGATSLVAGPLVPVPLGIDFRLPAWSGANNSATFTVGSVNALPSGPGNSVKLRQNSTDGLGVDSSAAFDDPSEVGPRESLTISFAGTSGNNLTGAWITKLFDEAIDDRGSLSLYGAGGFLTSFSFSGASSIAGDYFIDFGGPLSLTSAVFSADTFRFSELLNRDYSVAGFTRAASVPDNGSCMILLSVGLLGLLAVPKTRRNSWSE